VPSTTWSATPQQLRSPHPLSAPNPRHPGMRNEAMLNLTALQRSMNEANDLPYPATPERSAMA